MVRPGLLLYLYARRLRIHPVQEVLAGLGIAIGVALVFSVQIANNSIVASASDIARAVTGAANLQVVSRDPRGFDQQMVERVRALPEVANAAPALQQAAVLIGADGRQETVEIVGADPSLLTLTSNFDTTVELGKGVLLPTAVARRLGVPTGAVRRPARPKPRVSIHLRGRAFSVRVGAVLGEETVGVVADAKIAVASLPYLQHVAGLEGRVTRVLVEAKPARREAAAKRLRELAGGRLSVASTDADLRLLEQVTGPHDQATAFFAAMGGLVGLLLAFNAVLLTAPERRRDISELRILGFRPSQIAQLVLFQATILGLVASAVGLVAGSVLSTILFEQAPAYLAAAFPLGTETVVGLAPVLLSIGGGVLVTWLAAAPLLLDLRRRRAVDALYSERGEPGHGLEAPTRRRFLATALVILFATGSFFLVTPTAAIVACIGLGVATVLAIPTLFAGALKASHRLAEHAQRVPTLTVALSGLRATTLRSLALAATGAIAVFGSVAVDGGHRDLLRGLYASYWEYTDTADLWIVNRADDLATKDFRQDSLIQHAQAVPGVEAVRPYYGGFHDVAGRRVWLIARSRQDRSLIPSSGIVTGDLRRATRRLRRGGWITVSDQLADALHAEAGDAVALPTPSGMSRYRVAATTTNLGWTGGALVMNSADYRRAWTRSEPTALEVDLQATADPHSTARRIRAALGPEASGLLVQTTRERADQANALARQGLERLGQISILLLVAAALAMAAAMSTAIWQRRTALAEMRMQGFLPPQLGRVLLLESALVLAVGCVAGAAAGIYGELLIDRYLSHAAGFPAPFAPGLWETARTGLLVVAVAFLAVAAPAFVAARVSPRLALQP